MQLNKLVFFIFAVLLTASANATNIKVRFLNGIQNDQKSIKESVDVLYGSYKLYRNTTAPAIPKENFGSYSNPKDPLVLGDLIELSIQGTLAGIAQKYAIIATDLKVAKAKRAGLVIDEKTQNDWYASIYQKTQAEVYANYLAGSSTDGTVNIAGVSNSVLLKIREDLQDGSSIVVVSHSQGNFFAETVYSQLTESERQRVRFVGVASVAPSTPNGRYVTFGKDLAVFGAFALLKQKLAIFSSDPLPKNEDGYYTGAEGVASWWSAITNPAECLYRWINCPSAMGHSFIDVYMNPQVVVSSDNLTPIAQKIIGYVGESINELSVSTITATITGGSDGGSYSFTNFQTKKMYAFNGGTAYMPQFVATDANGNKLEVTYCAVDSPSATNFCDNNTYGYWYVAFTKASGNKYAAPGGGFQTTGSHRSGESIGTFTADIGLTTNGASRLAVSGNLNVRGIPITQCGTTPLANCF